MKRTKSKHNNRYRSISLPFERKITAIFSADITGYSRLMSEDEPSTVLTMTRYRDVMATLVKQHRGRVVNSPGDNVLAEFVSVVDAVQCAVAVQKEIQARNADLPEDRRMPFRIGINLGDVIVEGERIYGDGVNIAARLESMADPGGICISRTAFDQIESKLPLGYENNAKARQLFEDAVALDPEYSVAYMSLARTHLRDVWYGWTRSPQESLARAMTSAEESLTLDSPDPGIHGLLSQIHLFKGQHEKAVAEGKRALALSPNSIEGYSALGMSLYYGGRYEEAIRSFEKAIALEPMPPTWLLHNLGNGYLMIGRYADAIAAYNKALHRNPKSLWAQVGLAAAYEMSGGEKEASEAATRILQANPFFSLDYFERILPYKSQEDKERFVRALRKAGLGKK